MALGALALTGGLATAVHATADSSTTDVGRLAITLTAHDGFKLDTCTNDNTSNTISNGTDYSATAPTTSQDTTGNSTTTNTEQNVTTGPTVAQYNTDFIGSGSYENYNPSYYNDDVGLANPFASGPYPTDDSTTDLIELGVIQNNENDIPINVIRDEDNGANNAGVGINLGGGDEVDPWFGSAGWFIEEVFGGGGVNNNNDSSLTPDGNEYINYDTDTDTDTDG
ncbi:hypothetical protein [Mycobacterium pseudokansasii]|uniref:Uncharacterized protein n=1 Tax=Mycobacterium pseudokansasii TaxID=2341080 RepID=A0A498R095_9MYCO|nr:hypothetical protein [Mycobacterium pseudokansasii]VBA55747.1 hypothetical protein LAUMK142_05234 [Mycobacterium pseudokansasii]